MKKSMILAVMAVVGCLSFKEALAVTIYDASRTYKLTIKPFGEGTLNNPSRTISSKGKKFIGSIKSYLTKKPTEIYQIYYDKNYPSFVIDSIPARVCLDVKGLEYYKLKDTKTPIDKLSYMNDVRWPVNRTDKMKVRMAPGVTPQDPNAVFVVDVGATTPNRISIKLMSKEFKKGVAVSKDPEIVAMEAAFASVHE